MEKDPRLDFYSDKFDPLYALTAGNDVVLPVPNAKIYDNISAYHSAQSVKRDTHAQNVKQKAGNSKITEEKEENVRRFLPHQMPVPSRGRKAKRNIFTRMETIDGPLKLLQKCVEEKLKIKVWTRNASTIRGYCTAYVTAFDKHWNLALSDIEEVWTRPKKRKTLTIDSIPSTGFEPRKKIETPPVTIVKVTKKTEICSRKVDQYILRGEHVVLISIFKDN